VQLLRQLAIGGMYSLILSTRTIANEYVDALDGIAVRLCRARASGLARAGTVSEQSSLKDIEVAIVRLPVLHICFLCGS